MPGTCESLQRRTSVALRTMPTARNTIGNRLMFMIPPSERYDAHCLDRGDRKVVPAFGFPTEKRQGLSDRGPTVDACPGMAELVPQHRFWGKRSGPPLRIVKLVLESCGT